MPNSIIKQKMFMDESTARIFAQRQENYRHIGVAEIFAKVFLQDIKNPRPWHLADLGGGAHVDRYNELFSILLQDPKGHIDWVDFYPHFIPLALEYLKSTNQTNRLQVISLLEGDYYSYLESIKDNTLDGIFMRYTLGDIEDINQYLKIVEKKLKMDGLFIATIQSSAEIKSIHSNARTLYKKEEFPENETRKLEEGEEYAMKFFRETDNPAADYLPGAIAIKYFHSPEKIKKLCEQYNLDCFIGNWKDIYEGKADNLFDQEILLIKKK